MRNTAGKLQGMIRDLVYYLRRQDFDSGKKWLFDTLRTFLWRQIEYIVLSCSLEKSQPDAEAVIPLTFRLAELEDIQSLKGKLPPSQIDFFRKQLLHGRICFLAFHEEKIIGYSWASTEMNPEIDNLEMRLGPGEVYFGDSYVFPAYRRRGVISALHARKRRFLQERGFTRGLSIAAVDNIPSIQYQKKLGFQEAGRLSFRRILLKREYRYSKQVNSER